MTASFLHKALRLAPAFLLAASLASAEQIRVNDAGQLRAVAAAAKPGDVLVMRNGVWSDQKLLFRAEGAADRPIVLRTETPGQVILRGDSRLNLAGRHLVVEGLWFDRCTTKEDLIEFRASSAALATNCTLRHTAITDCNPLGARSENRWLSLYGVSNLVEFCRLEGKTNRGTTLVVWLETNRPNHHVIRSNHFGPRPRLKVNGGETLRVGDSRTSLFPSRTLVEGNLFDRCNGEVEIVSNKSCDNTYLGNTFLECEGALTFRHGLRCRAEGNFFLGNGRPYTGGVRLVDADHIVVNNYYCDLRGDGARSALTMMNGLANAPLNGYAPVRRALIAFNTFVDCRHNFLIGRRDGGGKLAPTDCVIANNLVRGSSGPLVELETAPVNFTWEGNWFFGAPVGITQAGISTADPLLARGDDGIWRPARGSPVIDAAVGHYPGVRGDLDGQTRPGAGRDVGADEVMTAPVSRRPLRPGDVGPAWWKERR
jgi:poly(beta-D-mannuronate) lyase